MRVFGDPRFHTDGDLLALAFGENATLWSLEDPGVLRQWDPVSGQQLQQHALSDLDTLWVFSPQARLLASASDDLSLWDVATGRLLTGIQQPSWVTAIAIAGDCHRVATGHDDHMLRIWDIASQQLVRELSGPELPVSAVAFSADGARLAGVGEDRLIHIWDVASGRQLVTLAGHTDRVPALAWHPNGKLIVSAGWDTTARVWNAVSGEPIILLNSHADQVVSLAFSPDGQWLACADSAFAIHIWDPTNWETRRILKGHTDEIRCLAFGASLSTGAPGSTPLLASGGSDRVISLWDLRRGEVLSNPEHPARHSISVGPDTNGPRLASSTGGAALCVWDTSSGKTVLRAAAGGGGLQSVACSPDGRWVASGSSDNVVRLWDAASGEVRTVLEGQKGPVAALAFTPDGATVASASATDGTVWLWETATGKPILLIPEAADGCSVDALAFHPNGRWLACGGIDWLATGGTDGAVCIWDVVQPDRLGLFDRGTRSMAIHPAGKWLATASLEEAVYVWDLETQEQLLELAGHKEGVTCVAFSPDGRWLVSGSDDRQLRFWAVPSGELVAERELDTAIKVLCFAPDGTSLFTGNGNTTCYQLDVKKLLP
jgi:WD40 repeat protein